MSGFFGFDPESLGAPEPWQLERVRKLKSGEATADIPVLDFDDRPLGRVLTLTTTRPDREPLVETFVRWRNQIRTGWLDQRQVTPEGTRQWLETALGDDRRLNRLVYVGDDRLIGRTGFVDLGRRGNMSDGIVRGERGGGMNFMHFVNFACMAWDFEHLDLSTMYSKVLVTNDLAMESTRTLGYRILGDVPLYRVETASGPVFTEISTSGAVATGEMLRYLGCDRQCFEAARLRAWKSRSFNGL